MAQQNEFEYFDSVNKFATENQSNKTQQTAVEWFIDRIKNQHLYGFTPLHELEEQAKAMEKEQIIDAANDVLAQQDSTYYGTPNLGKQYYNKTYTK
jgi:hypothetical protein